MLERNTKLNVRKYCRLERKNIDKNVDGLEKFASKKLSLFSDFFAHL